MEEPIKEGDLVMVVRGHECTVKAFGGLPIRVTHIHPRDFPNWDCSRCNGKNVAPGSAYIRHAGASIPLPWLKRIPPLSELDDLRQDEEIEA